MFVEYELRKRKVDCLRAILETLRDTYVSHKGDSPAKRYDELKAMIKCAVCQFKTAEKQFKKHVPQTGGRQGLISKLRDATENFASSIREIQTRQQTDCNGT